MIWIKWMSVLAIFLALSPAANAQIPDKKDFDIYTSGGVDLFSGQFRLYSKDISVGSGEFPSRLDLIREVSQYAFQAGGRGYVTHNFSLSAYCFPCAPAVRTYVTQDGTYTTIDPDENFLTIKAFDGVHSFKSTYVPWGSPRTWTNEAKDGATVNDSGGVLEYISKTGDRIIFAGTYPDGTGIGCGGQCRVPIYAIMANGEALIFTYENTTSSGWPSSRLTSVVNSRGYGLQFNYLNSSLTAGIESQRELLTGVSAFRTACVAGVVSCTTGRLPSVSYNWSLVGANVYGEEFYRMTSFTNVMGRVLNYEYNGFEWRMTAAYYADNPDIKLFRNVYGFASRPCSQGTVTQMPPIVSQQTDANGHSIMFATNYCPLLPRRRTTMEVTAPDGGVTTYKFTGFYKDSVMGSPTEIVNPALRTFHYTYDNGRLATTFSPLGGSETNSYDDRGNIVQKSRAPNTGSLQGEIVETSGFPTCDGSNYRFCNKPIYTIDGLGNRTDYSYDPASGQIAVKLEPADGNNMRAVTRYIYSQFYPAPGVTPPSGQPAISAFFLTQIDRCLQSSVTGATVDFNYQCPASSRIRTTFLYTASTASARSNFELEGVVEEAGGLTTRRCYRYDISGNRIAETQPRALLATCS